MQNLAKIFTRSAIHWPYELHIIIPPVYICSAAVKPFEFAALPLERVSRRWKICVMLAVRLWRKGCFFRIFFAMEVVRKGSPLETTECDEKEIQRQQRGAKTASTLSDGKASTRYMFLAKMPRFAFSLTHHSNSFRSLGRPFLTKSLKRARRVTSEFHRINNKLGFAETSEDGAKIERKKGVGEAVLRRELLKLGGRTAYQEASELTTTRHRTSKWVFAIITQLGLRPTTNRHPLSLLEIGAVNTQLLSIPWLEVRAIDIQVCETTLCFSEPLEC